MSHLHDIYDTDKHFVIDPKTRLITTEETNLVLIQHDHNSERYTFNVPRYIEGHDMSLCNRIEVHYDNVSRDKQTVNSDFFTVTDMQVTDKDDSMIIFSWLITNSATQIVGKLQFSISFECVSEDGEVDYGWHTYYFDKVKVNTSIYNTEHVITEHSDFVSRIELLAERANTDLKAMEDILGVVENGSY